MARVGGERGPRDVLYGRVPEDVIEVPKIVCPLRAARTVLRAPQTMEQLVEAPILVSLVRIFEQTVGIPGRAGGRGVTGGLQGFLVVVEQIVDTPFPHRGSSGSLQGFPPGQSSTALAAQIIDIPVPHGARQDPDLPSAASSSGLLGTANEGGFRTFPSGKKVQRWVRTRGRNWVLTSAHPRRFLM